MTMIEVSLYRAFRHKAQAVERPNAPLPMIMIDFGISSDVVGTMLQLKDVRMIY